MAQAAITKRLVVHVGGYDPMPPATVHSRFIREARRFESTWSVRTSVSSCEIEKEVATWRVATSGPDWSTDATVRLLRWDDVIERIGQRRPVPRLGLGLLAFLEIVGSGAFFRYLRANWRYGLFFLYPYLLLAIFAGLGVAAGAAVARTGWVLAPLMGLVTALAVFWLLTIWIGGRLSLPHLLDDWIFSRDYVRTGDAGLAERLEHMAGDVARAARSGEADEIVIVGHSLGAVLAVDLLARILRIEPRLGQAGTPLRLLTIGSSLLKIGLIRHARRFREMVGEVAAARHVPWAEYQALTDVMNFYKTDPVAEMGLEPRGRPLIRIVRLRRMLDPKAYARMRGNFFRLHCQFISGNDRRAAYDYFMTLLGPLPFKQLVGSADGAVSLIGPDGSLGQGAGAPVEKAEPS
jgi:hypothetical protein